ncbi:hypothetical protein LCGC14_3076600 [marine sediment metagenome]|uniref:Uncharacterized protein n=1 Tax=marine sediment metagenome TaxID=412755 RepID=A0A0F8WED2_9ZZZZ
MDFREWFKENRNWLIGHVQTRFVVGRVPSDILDYLEIRATEWESILETVAFDLVFSDSGFLKQFKRLPTKHDHIRVCATPITSKMVAEGDPKVTKVKSLTVWFNFSKVVK